MGHAGRQFQALLWKNWLCRLRHPVLSLAEFFWPCLLFTILTVLRFQELPRHRDNCYLEARDLPSRGVLPFVQGLLCNTGSRCRNFSYVESSAQHFRSENCSVNENPRPVSRSSLYPGRGLSDVGWTSSSPGFSGENEERSQAAADRETLGSLPFLTEIQDLAEGIYETMDKAEHLQKRWAGGSQTPGSPGSSGPTMDLQHSEELIATLETLQQRPHLWDFLLSLPALEDDGLSPALLFLRAVRGFLTSLEDSAGLPLNHTFSWVSGTILNVTISTLTTLQRHGAALAGSGSRLSLRSAVWEPQKVQSDLQARFGFDELHTEQILNYSAELREMLTASSLERLVCSALSSTSQAGAAGGGHRGDCQLQWSEAKSYLVRAVSWLRVYRQVLDRWQQGGVLQEVLTGAGCSLGALAAWLEEGSGPWQVVQAVRTGLLLLHGSLVAEGPEDKRSSPKTSRRLQQLQSLLHTLPARPARKRQLPLDGALRNAVAQDLGLIQEILLCLETSVNDSMQGELDRLKLEKDVLFWELKQVLSEKAAALCLKGHWSEKGAEHPGTSRVCWGLRELLCHHDPSNGSSVEHKLCSVQDADQILQGVTTGQTDVPVSTAGGYLGWQELPTQLSEGNLSCARLSQLLGAGASPGGCKQLISAVVCHMSENSQLSLDQTLRWEACPGLLRDACKVARSVSTQESFLSRLSDLPALTSRCELLSYVVFSVDSACYEENMDWGFIRDNDVASLDNVPESPVAAISRALNFTKHLLMMKKLYSTDDERVDFLLSFVEVLENPLSFNPVDSQMSVPKFHSLPSTPENILHVLDTSTLWLSHLKSLEVEPSSIHVQKFLEFGKEVTERIQTLESNWMSEESGNLLRFLELIRNSKLPESWLYGTSKEKGAKLDVLSILLNLSVPENEKILSKSFDFSQLLRSDWPDSPATNVDLVHLSKAVISRLSESGFLGQEQVSEALDEVYVIKNTSDLFIALPEPQKQEVDNILTHLINIFKDKDSALLLQVYSSFYQSIYKFLSTQSRESLLTFLTQISKCILDIIKQFNFQDISKAFAFLSEAAGLLGGISEVPPCQQLLSIFNFLELQAESLMSTEGQELEGIHATLTGLKQLLVVDEDFRISLSQYMSQFFSDSPGALFGDECFVWENKQISPMNSSTDEGSSLTLPWARSFSELSANGGALSEFLAIHCTVSWLQMWTDIWGSLSEVCKLDTNVFTSLHVGLTQLLDELEKDVRISKTCQRPLPTRHAARLILRLFKNVSEARDAHDWNDLWGLTDLWVALGDMSVAGSSLSLDRVERSLVAMGTVLHRLRTFLFSTDTGREFWHPLLGAFTALSNTREGAGVGPVNCSTSNNLTHYGAKLAPIIPELRDTISFLRNVSWDQDLSSCADVLKNAAAFILEDGVQYKNASRRTLRVLAMLNSTFSSEDNIRRLQGCMAWVDAINRLSLKYNSSFPPGHLQRIWGSFRDVKDKMNSTLKIVNWVLNVKKPPCSLTELNTSCLNIYLKDVTDFLNNILTRVLEKERVLKFEIMLALLNDSTNQVKMVIRNLTVDWKHFAELILRPLETADEIPTQFQNTWLCLMALGKEIQKLVKEISPNFRESNSSSNTEKAFSTLATSPKENVNSLGNSIYYLARDLALDLSLGLQNWSIAVPREITMAMGLGIQLARDVFSSLVPATKLNIPPAAGHVQDLKVAAFLHSLRKADIDLVIDQLVHIRENLVTCFRNVSRLGAGNSGVNLLVDLMEKSVGSSHCWSVNHLLRLLRLFPKDEVSTVVDAYYALAPVGRLLRGLADKNITEALRDVCDFTLLHGVSVSDVAKEDFATVIKALSDMIESLSDKPETISEALPRLPVLWCWSRTTFGLRQNPMLEACRGRGLGSSSFYSQVVLMLDHLHLASLGGGSWCANESSQMEITGKVVCAIHELMGWNSILLEGAEVFRVNMSLAKAMQEFWHKVLPFFPPSGNQSNHSFSELCPGAPIKQVVLQIMSKLKNANFTKLITSGENLLNEPASSDKNLNVSHDPQTSAQDTAVSWESIIKSISGHGSLDNRTRYLLSPLTAALEANLPGRSLEALSRFLKGEIMYDFEELWLVFAPIMKDLAHDIGIGHLIPAIKEEIQRTNSVEPQNRSLQLIHLLESLDSPALKALDVVEEFLLLTRNWLHKDASAGSPGMTQTLLDLMSADGTALLTEGVTTFLGHLGNTSGEGVSEVPVFARLPSAEQPASSSAQLPFEGLLTSSAIPLAGGSPAAAPDPSDVQQMNVANLPLNLTQSENGGKTAPPSSTASLRGQLYFLRRKNTGPPPARGSPRAVIAGRSADEMCQVFWQPVEPSEALEMLQKVSLVALQVLLILAENPPLTRDVLCAALSCQHGGTRRLLLSAVQGFALGQDHYQEIEKMWSSPTQLTCEHLIRNLSRALGSFKSNLENATAQDCVCQPGLGPVQQHVHRLAKSLAETWLSGFPIATFLSNFTVTEDVKIKDLMNNVPELIEELRSSVHISDEAIDSILEANVSHSKVLWSALTAALSGRCDQEILRLLLTLPQDETSRFVTEELCGLPGSRVYLLLVSMGRNLNLRSFVYKTRMPPEARGLLHSLSDVVSSLSSLLGRAQHILRHLPAFLHTLNIDGLLDTSGFQQVPRGGLARGSVFGSFQTVVKMVCKDQASFLSDSNTFISLPRVNELLEDDKEKFNIPEDSTPFCLKLYQEILQSPNGAMVWSFLKPVLHGKILYTPNTPEIHQVIQKANSTFHFVDKLKALLGTLLKMSSLFQGSGSGQVFNQLQKALRNKFIRRFIEVQLHVDVDTLMEKLQTYGGMLEKMFNHTGTDHIRLLGHVLVNLSSCVTLNRFQAMDSVDALESKAQELMKHNNFLASVIFNSSLVRKSVPSASLKLPPHVTYTIRTSVLYSMRTDMVKNPSWKFHPQSLPADGFKYNYLFVPLQDMIERAIIAVQTGHDAPEPAAQTQAAPYPCHTSDLFLNNVGFFFPLIMMLTWMVSVASMVRKLVYEREIQIEEYLRMMGVHPATHFLAWFLENMAVLAASSAALAIVLKASGIFAHSNACVVFLYLLDFGVSIVMLSYFLSTLFDRANTAALCTSLVYMVSFLPYIVLLVLRNQLSPVVQMFLCLLSTTAFGQGVFFITFLEGQEAGIQWSNMYQAPEHGGMTFGWVCWMILFDSSLYFLCGWYLSNLIPGSFGVRRPWYFPVTGSYWRSLCGFLEKRPSSPGSSPFVGSPPQHGEGELRGGHLGVSLVSVTKDYEGHKAAVQDLSLTFHRGQIAALLGTNGAGKTTIISLLTGLHPPTSGTIIVDGKNLQTDLSKVRRELGVCPQHDVLFDSLTVQEHLLLFGSIKAPWWTQEELRQQVAKTLQDVELTQHQHKPTRALSGGTKRKLSLGIAFMGTSRTVVLDEPTSGVDPCSRRSLWDILLRYREGRTIVFTTHHLDEVEVLSDCVAVLQHGRLRCCGPPVCLKEAHGQGLRLTLTQQPPVLGARDPEDLARVTSLIQVYIPQASLKGSSGGELTYTIPKDANTTCFKGLFQALDQNQQQLHLASYGLSDTTLEEVFLTLLQDSNEKSHLAPGNTSEPQKRSPAGRGSPVRPPPVQGRQLLVAQVAALLQKRLRHTLRAWRGTLSDLLLPVLFVALAMGLFMVRPLATSYPPLRLTPGHYAGAETYFFSSGDDDMDLTHMLLRKFRGQGLICADLNPDLRNSSCWRRDLFSHPEFQDSCGCLRCPNRSAGAPYLTSGLGHTLLNLSGTDVEEYLLLPSEKPRLGGWSFGVRLPGKAEAANTSTSKSETLAKVWYNQKSFHSLPSYLNHLNNLVLWRHLPPAADWQQYGITLYSHPYGGALLNEDKILESIRQCGVALCIVLGFSILSASIGSSVVRDRVTGAKRLQHISGLGYRTYWFTNFLYDMLFYLISVGLCVAIIVPFQLTAFTFRENLAATALLLVLFGYATLPWMYLMSGIFSSADVALISYISMNFIFGLCTMLMTIVPRLLAIVSKAQNLQNIYDVLKWAFTIFPQFCLGQGLIELCYNQIKYDLTHNFGVDSYVSPFEMSFLGWIFVELAVQGTVVLLLRILLHWDLLRPSRGPSALRSTGRSSKDVDVWKEQLRVSEGRTEGDLLVLRNLSKRYGNFCKKTSAVHDVSVAIRRGECFGLLGTNGAGKTTVFGMLTGEVGPSSGRAVVRTPAGDHVALSSAGEAGILIGYCPQQDALDGLLTGREHLRYYCSLRGIPKQHIPEVVGDLLRRLHLEAHADKPVATYSGGTKRKLSTALALVGKPDILLLDEPSSGMDPCSKRYLWQTILAEVREGCAAVLTSHSMEECEVLCTRLAVMVCGSFRCLGSPEHVKDRFGDGYAVKVWLCKEARQPGTVSDCLSLHFPGTQFKGQRLNLLEYQVPKRWGCLADLFKVLENNKTTLNIEHYSVSQTTLEQVFIRFATEQQPTPQPRDGRDLHHLPV